MRRSSSLRSVLDVLALFAVIAAASTYVWDRLVPTQPGTGEHEGRRQGEPPPIPLPTEPL